MDINLTKEMRIIMVSIVKYTSLLFVFYFTNPLLLLVFTILYMVFVLALNNAQERSEEQHTVVYGISTLIANIFYLYAIYTYTHIIHGDSLHQVGIAVSLIQVLSFAVLTIETALLALKGIASMLVFISLFLLDD